MSGASFQVVSPPRRTDLTLDEVAEILRCSRYLVRRLVQDGELPAYRVGKFLFRPLVGRLLRLARPHFRAAVATFGPVFGWTGW